MLRLARGTQALRALSTTFALAYTIVGCSGGEAGGGGPASGGGASGGPGHPTGGAGGNRGTGGAATGGGVAPGSGGMTAPGTGGGRAGQAGASGGAGGNSSGSGGTGAGRAGTSGTAGATGGSTSGTGGGGTAGAGAITTTVIATASAGLTKPTDLEFNPFKPGELWVTNHGDDSMTIIASATTAPMPQRRRDDSHGHFMPSPTSIAFGDAPTTIVDASGAPVNGTFATCSESRNGGDDFMGPVLWTPDLRIFAVSKEMRQAPFNGSKAGDLGSHLDMLHMSPLCAGIAWEGAGNVYWTYSGLSKAFVRYDFRADHWIGNDDHSDGAEWRYTFPGQLGYVAGIPSHIAYRKSEQAVYFSDTANGRVVKFLPASATSTTTMRNPDGLQTGPSLDLGGAALTVVIAKGMLQKPSGLELHDDALYVTDNASGVIYRFTTAGALVGSVQTDVKSGGLSGITVGPDGKLYFVDMVGNRVLRLDSKL